MINEENKEIKNKENNKERKKEWKDKWISKGNNEIKMEEIIRGMNNEWMNERINEKCMTERNNERTKKRNNMIIHHRSAQYLIRGEEVAHLLESITCNTTTAELYNWNYGRRLYCSLPLVRHLWLN